MPRMPERAFDREEPEMIRDRARADVERERPAPRHVLDDPEVRGTIERALKHVRGGESRRGMTAVELLRHARDQQRRLGS
jgi:hypothetical protein